MKYCLSHMLMAKKKTAGKNNAGVTTHRIQWCDNRCPHADFAKLDAMDGSCRTFQSLWCDLLQKHVTKNAPCEKRFGKRRPTTGF